MTTPRTSGAAAGGSAAARRAWGLAPVVVGAMIVLLAYMLGSSTPFRANQLTLWVVLGMLALSLTLVWGKGGIFSFGQGALFGIGAYTYSIVAINFLDVTNETVTAVVAAALAAAVVAAFLGYFMFYGNVSDVYVAIITLATALVLLTFMGATAGPQWRVGNAALGGYNGMAGVPSLTVGWPGGSPHVLTVNQTLAATLVTAFLLFLAVRYLLQRPFGRILAGLRDNEERTQLLGFDTRGYKLAVFTVGGAIAGMAGAGYAAWGLFINPAVFGLQQAALVVIWVLVGGRESLAGAFVGVVLVQGLSARLGAGAGSWTPIVLGGVLILIVLLLPAGLVPTVRRGLRRLAPALHPPPRDLPRAKRDAGLIASAPGGDVGPLGTDHITKVFGGLVAVNDVTLQFPQRGVHSLIGPNGAGKSTYFSLLAGRHRATSGTVYFGDQDITRKHPHQRARMGLGIKLQVPSVYTGLAVAENLWLAAYASQRNVAGADQRASDLLRWLRLTDYMWSEAGTLAHGQQQRLEIGLVLARRPAVVLLDEPTAGMTREETSETAALVRELGEHAAVIVVEHDMTFVRQLESPATLLHQGSVFVTGTLDELRSDDRVLDIYLGRKTHA